MTTLTENQSHMLMNALEVVEGLKLQKRQLDEQINSWYNDLEATFGSRAEYRGANGETAKWSISQSRRTKHKQVLDEVRENANQPLARFIDQRREELASTGTTKTLKGVTKAGTVPQSSLQRRVRQSVSRRGGDIAGAAQRFGITEQQVRELLPA